MASSNEQIFPTKGFTSFDQNLISDLASLASFDQSHHDKFHVVRSGLSLDFASLGRMTKPHPDAIQRSKTHLPSAETLRAPSRPHALSPAGKDAPDAQAYPLLSTDHAPAGPFRRRHMVASPPSV
ncbi:hypothetical protein V6N12_011684 [Hibiscus sabdariffa]|uniref:Uncharacterized protein n=1 Tax=Hibiscus sabdariffa TaxID=183260 RepID=A0ABR2B7L2_9ROSI